jgi:hypothetical protein
MLKIFKQAGKNLVNTINGRRDTIFYLATASTVVTGWTAYNHLDSHVAPKLAVGFTYYMAALSIGFREYYRGYSWLFNQPKEFKDESEYRNYMTKSASAVLIGSIGIFTTLGYVCYMHKSLLPLGLVPFFVTLSCLRGYAALKHVKGVRNAFKIWATELFDYPRRPQMDIVPPAQNHHKHLN